ncbi:hypothetical protein ACWA2C_27940 [Priestia megaterium]
MEHTLDWLNAKFKQAQKDKWEQSQVRVWEGVKSLLVTLDIALNKGKSVDKIMPPSYESALEEQQEKTVQEETFVQGQWWVAN